MTSIWDYTYIPAPSDSDEELAPIIADPESDSEAVPLAKAMGALKIMITPTETINPADLISQPKRSKRAQPYHPYQRTRKGASSCGIPDSVGGTVIDELVIESTPAVESIIFPGQGGDPGGNGHHLLLTAAQAASPDPKIFRKCVTVMKRYFGTKVMVDGFALRSSEIVDFQGFEQELITVFNRVLISQGLPAANINPIGRGQAADGYKFVRLVTTAAALSYMKSIGVVIEPTTAIPIGSPELIAQTLAMTVKVHSWDSYCKDELQEKYRDRHFLRVLGRFVFFPKEHHKSLGLLFPSLFPGDMMPLKVVAMFCTAAIHAASRAERISSGKGSKDYFRGSLFGGTYNLFHQDLLQTSQADPRLQGELNQVFRMGRDRAQREAAGTRYIVVPVN